RHIDERFAALGATRLAERIEADGEGDEPFRQFCEQLWKALPTGNLEASTGTVANDVKLVDSILEDAEPRWSRKRPFAANVLATTLITAAASEKETRHIILSLKGADLRYEPGDALGVLPRQAPELVEAVLAASGASADAPVCVDEESLALHEALSVHRDVTTLSASTLIKFANLSADSRLQALVQRDQSAALEAFLYGKDLLDLLQDYPNLTRDAQALVDLLPPLKPRLYSICSSP